MKTTILALLVTTSTVSGDQPAHSITRRELATKVSELTAVVEQQIVELELLELRLEREVMAAKAEAEREREARLTLPKEIPGWVVPVIVASFAVGFGTGTVVATAL